MNDIIKSSDDLQTLSNDTKRGFIEIALRKGHEAAYYIDLANHFETKINKYKNPYDLVKDSGIQISMCEAAGISTKARSHLDDREMKFAITEFIENFILDKGEEYQREIINRYLLTQGDALGGRMRNIVGKIAAEKVSKGILSEIAIKKYRAKIWISSINEWHNVEGMNYDLVSQIKAIKWKNQKNIRTLFYDLTVPIVRKNIDLVLFRDGNANPKNKKEFKSYIGNPDNYFALGELKGGIDPAGADEHWKTAKTALTRIRTAFSEKDISVKTFFIGAAIEKAMASEIFDEWKSGKLSMCANITKNDQFNDFCNWIVEQ